MPEKENEEKASTRHDDLADVLEALHDAATGGDTESARILIEKKRDDEVEELKYKLFGI